jgi:hypothetical protein
VNNRIQAARKVLKAMIDHSTLSTEHKQQLRSLSENKLERAKEKKTGRSTERNISKEEVLQMIETFKQPIWGEGHNKPRTDMALLIEFLWKTGARISEATGILLTELKTFNRETYEIRLHGKGDVDRTVYVPKELISRIKPAFVVRGTCSIAEPTARARGRITATPDSTSPTWSTSAPSRPWAGALALTPCGTASPITPRRTASTSTPWGITSDTRISRPQSSTTCITRWIPASCSMR